MPFELSVDLTTLAILAAVAFVAGFIDAIAGGGGLLTTPALLTAGLPPHLVLGTNKLSSTFGAGIASLTFYRRRLFHPGQWRRAIFGTLCGALIGAGLGFLWFNAPPAAVFMGDTGSLALGGTLGAIAVVAHHEFVLAIIGGLFVVEALSVIIQVLYFKRTGKRVFLMAPIHHHFEKKGWKESQIVIRFWIIALVLALIGLSTLKLR